MILHFLTCHGHMAVSSNNFENVVNHRVDIQENIKCYQDTLSYTSSKVDYSMGEGIYMLPGDMNLKTKPELLGITTRS